MANEPIPVYVFTGFLESGKTKFIQDILADPNFTENERTVLLLCEEGIEEYDEKWLRTTAPRLCRSSPRTV